jgi:hypothetical protein
VAALTGRPRQPLWPLALLGLAQAFMIAWLVGDVVEDNPGPLLAVAPVSHGHGAPTATGPAPIVGNELAHYLGLAAFAAHAVLPALSAAVVVSRRLVARHRGRVDGLVGGLVFALAVGAAGAAVATVTCWLGMGAAGTGTAPVAALAATTAFRYSFLLALVFAALGGTRWLGPSTTRYRTPAAMPGELRQEATGGNS